MPDLSKRIDPLGFPILGLIGLVACGPSAPQQTGTDGTDGTDGTGTHTGTEGTSVGPSTDPTETTRPTTTEPPMPECQSDSDCDQFYCGYCSEGMCRESVGCCGGYGATLVASKWRCSPPFYCYSDEECGFGYACLGGQCSESQPIPLPSCEPPDGDGSQWNLSNSPSAFILADLDGDLDLDLAAAEPASASIEIALNDGAGHFLLLAEAFNVNISHGMALAAGDIDLDGDVDLAVTDQGSDGVLRLLFNDGAVFTVGEPRVTAPFPMQVFIADVNGDKFPDVVTLNEGTPEFGIQLGDGTGQLSPEQPGTAEKIMRRARVADLSLDGVADMLAPIANTETVGLFAGGQGELLHQFSSPNEGVIAALSDDLDLNGFPDVVAVGNGMAQVWLGISVQEWTSGRQRFLSSKALLGGVMVALDDVAGADLISATGGNDIVLLRGDGSGGFACETVFENVGTSAPEVIAVGDIDGDGRPDILAGGLDTPTINVTRTFFGP